MTTTNGGTAVKGGYYLSKSHWEIFPIEHDGERLPGPVAEHYVKVRRRPCSCSCRSWAASWWSSSRSSAST